MIPETGPSHVLAMAQPSVGGDVANTSSENGSTSLVTPDSASNPAFAPPKTDKPRPHVCGTCGRSFARLEHLKRHERSHTKEKPFECPQCARCFARRDLLLRHQQKLHQAGAPSSRAKSGRRESIGGASSNGTGRVRKNSLAGNTGSVGVGVAGMRPRANTISHVDATSLNFMGTANPAEDKSEDTRLGYSHPNLGNLPGPDGFDYRGMSRVVGHHGQHQPLPKLETAGLGPNIGGGLRTAPPFQISASGFNIGPTFGSESTINPAQLHFGGSLSTPVSSLHSMVRFPGVPALDDDESHDWTSGFDSQLSLNGTNEHAIDGSSSSALSTASPTGFSEVIMDGSNNPTQVSAFASEDSIGTQSFVSPAPYATESMGPVFPEVAHSTNTVSPKDLHEQIGRTDVSFGAYPPFSSISPMAAVSNVPNHHFSANFAFSSDSPSITSSSVTGSARQSSVTSVSSDSITDYTRQALILGLSQPTAFGRRKNSQQSLNSPLSPSFGSAPIGNNAPFPSTGDLQRYVSTYITYFHPHLPFLHLPTLSFESPEYTSSFRMPSIHEDYTHSGGEVGGSGCLMLAMAAIGALYEYESGPARELFEGAKKLIQLYLEDRRKAEMSAMNGSAARGRPPQETPLWLVQAMLLNVIYGHECGDKVAADIASNHCAALVSLARSADLTHPEPESASPRGYGSSRSDDVDMREAGLSEAEQGFSAEQESLNVTDAWLRWRTKEERKRTLFAVFILSSLLVTAYNHTPSILNSEIRLDLPCEETLWAAENAHTWSALGGAAAAEQQSVSFAEALTYLLGASQRESAFGHAGSLYYHPLTGGIPTDYATESDIKPSTFGCFVLINALHNYIWETRQRHQGRPWTPQETESLHAHVEPALRAWQAAWRSNTHHSLERANPYGILSADSVPLLDLAYVRLFVNLGRSKEAFWQRDYETMAEELARGSEIIQHADHSPVPSPRRISADERASRSSNSPHGIGSPAEFGHSEPAAVDRMTDEPDMPRQSSRRERHLRKAALYAAESLLMSDKLGMSFTDFTARELPIQSAMCIFDCAQVLAEWVATVQERVGRYLGVLGRDDIDLTQVPAIILLEDGDCELLGKISTILASADMKMALDMNGMASPSALSTLAALPKVGFGSKLLMITAYQLEKAAVWPVVHNMTRALETHAAHMDRRTEASLA